MKGITFGSYHSYDDLSLILNSKEISPPLPKTEKVDVPGSDGELDLTEFFGGVKFKNRKFSAEFTYIGAMSTFENEVSTVENALNGVKCNIVLDDDQSFYYIGRATVDKAVQEKSILKFSISADCEPYKLKSTETTVSKAISGSGSVTLTNLKKPVVPVISTTGAITITWNGGSASLSAGNNQIIPELILSAGNTTLTITGTANVTFKYREGGF